MPTLATANVEITARTGKYKASIADVKRRTQGFGKSATKSLRMVTLGLAAMGAAAGVAAVAIGVKLTRAMVRVGKATIVTAVRYDRLKIGLAAVAGGSKEAEIQLRRLEKVAKLPGLSFEGAIAGSTALQAAGLNAILAERSLLAFGNALVTVGKGADDLKGVNLALTQIVTKGTGFGQELRQLAERLPQIRKAMKDAFGIGSVEDFAKLNLSATQFIEGIVEEFEKLPKVAGTVANELENLGIAFDRLKEEVGKTMLGITQDTAKSLTGIIDTLRDIIPFWEQYQDQIGIVMGNIVTLAVAATGTMFTEMSALIIKLSPIIWKPLWFGFKQAMLGIDDAGARLTGKIMRRLGVISQETFEREMKKLEDSSKEISENMAENFRIGFQKSIDEAVAATQKRVPAIIKAWEDLLVGIQSNLDMLKATIPESIVAPAKKAVAELKKIAPGELDFLSLKPEDPKKIAKRLRESEQRILDFNETVNKEMQKRQEANLKNFQAFTEQSRKSAEEMREQFENATSGMRNAFSDFIVDSISDIDNLGDAWSAFVTNMKKAFIRAVAEMVANKAFQALADAFSNIGGGGGAGGGGKAGFGDFLQGISPLIAAINPVAGGIVAGIGAIGNFLEQPGANGQAQRAPGMVNNFFETDFANMDRNRLQKTVSQTIAPALAEDAVDGR